MMWRPMIIKLLVGVACVWGVFEMANHYMEPDCFAYPKKSYRSPFGPYVVAVESRVCPGISLNRNVAWLTPGGVEGQDFPVIVLSESSPRPDSDTLTPMKEPDICWLDEKRVEIHYFGDAVIQQNPDRFGEIEVKYVKHLSGEGAVKCGIDSPS